MLASLGEWKDEVSISESGRDSQTGKHKNGHSTMGTDPQNMARMGSSIQPQANTREFWWYTGSPLTSVPCGSFASHPVPRATRNRGQAYHSTFSLGLHSQGQSANTSNTDGFLASAWHYDGRDKNGKP